MPGTNNTEILSFEVEHIEYTHNIDINSAYAQARQLYKDGFRYWFNQEEIKEINLNNEQYQIRSPEEELLLTWFEIADRDTANNFLNTTQIATKLAERAKLNITDGTVMKLGKALKKYGYLRLSKKKRLCICSKRIDLGRSGQSKPRKRTTTRTAQTTIANRFTILIFQKVQNAPFFIGWSG